MGISDYISIASLFITAFIGYHIYFLSKRLKFSDKMKHRNEIRESVDLIMSQIRKGINSEVELINVDRYQKDYPGENDENGKGYTYLRAELKGKRFDGVEFFAEMPRELFLTKDKKLTFNTTKHKAPFIAFPVGVIPYDWIEFIDTDGDEFKYVPQFFVKFKGRENFPYQYLKYYKKSDVYQEGNDPIEMKYSQIQAEEFEG